MSQGRSVPARGQNGQIEPQLQALTPLECSFEVLRIEFGIIWVAIFGQNRPFFRSLLGRCRHGKRHTPLRR